MYDVNKYKYYAYEEKRHDGTTIPTCVAISTYAGKTVKGFAKLNPKDEWNWEKGRDLAAARCGAKIAEKRAARAERKVAEATAIVNEAMQHLNDMMEYRANANAEVDAAFANIDTLLKDM